MPEENENFSVLKLQLGALVQKQHIISTHGLLTS